MDNPRDATNLVGSGEAATPPLSITNDWTAKEKWCRKQENVVAEEMAQLEGDRLLAAGDEKGGMACLKIAALLRHRRDEMLEPF